jgi:hypothetical protein
MCNICKSFFVLGKIVGAADALNQTNKE